MELGMGRWRAGGWGGKDFLVERPLWFDRFGHAKVKWMSKQTRKLSKFKSVAAAKVPRDQKNWCRGKGSTDIG